MATFYFRDLHTRAALILQNEKVFYHTKEEVLADIYDHNDLAFSRLFLWLKKGLIRIIEGGPKQRIRIQINKQTRDEAEAILIEGLVGALSELRTERSHTFNSKQHIYNWILYKVKYRSLNDMNKLLGINNHNKVKRKKQINYPTEVLHPFHNESGDSISKMIIKKMAETTVDSETEMIALTRVSIQFIRKLYHEYAGYLDSGVRMLLINELNKRLASAGLIEYDCLTYRDIEFIQSMPRSTAHRRTLKAIDGFVNLLKASGY